jgi:hypothetical protein
VNNRIRFIPALAGVLLLAGCIGLDPTSSTNPVGTLHTVDITLDGAGACPVDNQTIQVTVVGANSQTINVFSDATGHASYTYMGNFPGVDTITMSWAACFGVTAQATKNWVVSDGDYDDDGCHDSEETGANESTGGDRDPFFYWDFYDVGSARGLAGAGDENFTKDKKIGFQDALIILDHFGHEASDANDHDLDRQIPDPAFPWQTTEALEPPTMDKVNFTDVLAALKSFGHDCSAPP